MMLGEQVYTIVAKDNMQISFPVPSQKANKSQHKKPNTYPKEFSTQTVSEVMSSLSDGIQYIKLYGDKSVRRVRKHKVEM